MKTLVTGATGFVGANLLHWLVGNAQAEVVITARETSNFWRIEDVKEQISKIWYVDLTDRVSVFEMLKQVKPDIIYHIATYGGFPGQTNEQQMISSNLIATKNLLDAAIEYGVQQFINTGSSSEYGIKNEAMREDDFCQPLNFYGITKLAATNYCAMMGKNLGYKVCTLRLFSPYGILEDNARLYPSIYNSLCQGIAPKLSKPDSVRDFIPIERVVNAYWEILKAPYRPGEIVNVGSGKQQTIKEFYYKIARSLQVDIHPSWGQAPQRAHEPIKWEADITKLKSLIEWDDNW